MAKIIKKHSSFFSWVFLPSLLLIASVFAVNFLSKPVESADGAACVTSADCNVARSNVCRVEDCDSTIIPGASVCVPVAKDLTNPACSVCNVCGNGVCEEVSTPPEFDPVAGTVSCTGDCIVTIGGVPQNLCLTAAGAPVGCSGAAQDGCCPTGCQGTTAGAATFDIDCTCITPCTPPPGIAPQCTPEAGTFGCKADCMCDFVLEGGSILIGREDDPGIPLNSQCQAVINALGTGGGCGFSPIIEPVKSMGVWGWLAVISVPGAFITAFKYRNRRKK